MDWIIIGIVVGAVIAVGLAVDAVDGEEEEEQGNQDYSPQPQPVQENNQDTHQPSPPVDTSAIISLDSEVGADYSELRDLLAAKEYRQADQETFRLMSQISLGRSDGWFEETDIDRFPCTDLRTIDRLWRHYSNEHFGFSIQREIYNQSEGDFSQLARKLGWLEQGDWQDYVDLTGEKLVPRGYLPSICASRTSNWFARFQNCGI